MNVGAWTFIRWEGLLNPLLFYALLAAGLGTCLYLFTTLKVEIRAIQQRRLGDLTQIHALEAALDEVRQAHDTVERDLRDIERQTGMLVPPAPARSGLNLSKRTQVLRRHRAGEDPVAIAAALELPRAEVDLLIKVQHLALEQMTPSG